MDKRRRGVPKAGMSSPPRSVKTGGPQGTCVPDIVTRTFDLVTSKWVIPYYLLASWFSFYYAPTAPSVPGPRPLDHVFFKVLPVVYLMGLLRHPPQAVCPLHDHARRYIKLGLVLCAIGDGVLAWDPVYLVHWAGLFQLGYLCFSLAFFQYYQPSRWSKIVFPMSLILVGILVYMIQVTITCTVIAVYAVFLTVLDFFALARLERCRTGPSYLGFAGVQLFVLSDFLLALNVLVPSLGRPVSDTIVAMTFYLGMLGIALSTYTITLCQGENGQQSGRSSGPGRSDSSASSVMTSGSAASF